MDWWFYLQRKDDCNGADLNKVGLKPFGERVSNNVIYATKEMEIKDLYIKWRTWAGILCSTVERENSSAGARETVTRLY